MAGTKALVRARHWVWTDKESRKESRRVAILSAFFLLIIGGGLFVIPREHWADYFKRAAHSWSLWIVAGGWLFGWATTVWFRWRIGLQGMSPERQAMETRLSEMDALARARQESREIAAGIKEAGGRRPASAAEAAERAKVPRRL
jgi:hypothetical protein